MSKFKTNEFKEEFAKWNKILEDSGHEEIEDFSLPDPPLKRWHALDFKKIDLELYAARKDHYDAARNLLNTYVFRTEFERDVWALYSEGYTIRGIAKELGNLKYRSRVFLIIKEIAKQIR